MLARQSISFQAVHIHLPENNWTYLTRDVLMPYDVS